jgi:Tfp pilus assembly PilM family ATPase
MTPMVSRLFSSAWPSVSVEIAARRVTAVAVSAGPDGPAVSAYATETLPEGALAPAINAANVRDAAGLAAALKRVFERLGSRPRRVGLVLPDTVGKVSLVRFDKVPPRAQDLTQLIHWQVRKTAPFKLEEAQVSFAPGVRGADGSQEFIVVMARRDIVEEYERACAAAGAHAGAVDLATLNLINAVLGAPRESAPEGDWLLLNVTPEYSSLALLRGPDVIFFRNRLAEDEGSLTDLVHQTAMYYEDRLGGHGFSRVVLAGAAANEAERFEHVRRSLEERLGTHVQLVDPRPAVRLRDRIAASPDLLDTLASPVGMILRA